MIANVSLEIMLPPETTGIEQHFLVLKEKKKTHQSRILYSVKSPLGMKEEIKTFFR